MNKTIKITTGLSLLLLGCLMMFEYLGISKLNTQMVLSITLVFYGFILTAVTFGNNRNGMLLLASSAFLYGIFLYVTENYVIFRTNQIYIPAILLIIGAAMLIVFLQDFKNVPVLFTSLALIVISILLIETKVLANVYFVEKTIRFAKAYWPIMLIIIGLGVLTRKR